MIQFTEIHGKVTDMCFLYSLFSETLKIQNKFLSRKWYFCMFLASNIFMENDIWNKKNGKMLKYSLYLHKHINLFSFFFTSLQTKSHKNYFLLALLAISISLSLWLLLCCFLLYSSQGHFYRFRWTSEKQHEKRSVKLRNFTTTACVKKAKRAVQQLI